MEAAELARWTRFAAKGGIGKCTATQDCIAESPDDLMFLKDDEITVLMQLPDQEGQYLGYCEGVVGRFRGIHVHFHSKLKKPVMTKRSSMSAAKSPTPTLKSPSPMSMLLTELQQQRPLSSSRSSRPPTDDEANAPPPMSYSSTSTVSDTVLKTPPHTATIHSQGNDTPVLLSPPVVASPTSPLSISPKKSPTKPAFTPPRSPSPPRFPSPPRSPSPPPASSSDHHDVDADIDPPSARFSLGSSDGELGIGLSLLQNLANDADDDWSSDDQSHYSKRSLTQTPEQMDDGSEPSNTTPQAAKSSRPVPETKQTNGGPRAASIKRSESDDWEGASDIYDDYRYSMASKLSRFSQASHPSAPPPIPENRIVPPRPQSTDSDASIYTQDSKNSQESSSKGQTISIVEQPPEASKNRPSSLNLSNSSPSPLLHTTWGSPLSSPSAYSATSFFTPSASSPAYSNALGGIATAFRQQIELERASTNSPHSTVGGEEPKESDTEVRQVVIEDDEELPPHAQESELSDHRSSSPEVSPEQPTQPLPTLAINSQLTPPPSMATSLSPIVESPSSPPDIAPPPPSGTLSPTPRPPLPSLSELRGYAPDAPQGSRTSLFLPHPNAPKPTASSAGPMYIRSSIYQPPMPSSGPRNPSTNAANVIKMAVGGGPKPGSMRGPTIYGIVEFDLGSATGPVPIQFSVEPPAAVAPSVQVARPVLSPLRTATTLSPPGQGGEERSPTVGGVIPRANFFPKAGTARPRSRSFSGFNTTPTKLNPMSADEGSATLGIPRSSASPSSPPSLPALRRPASSSKLRPSYAPSPLALPRNNMAGGANGMKSPISPVIPPSPTVNQHPLRQVTSMSLLTTEGTEPRPSGLRNVTSPDMTSPSVLHKQHSLQSVNGSAHSRQTTGDSGPSSSRDPDAASVISNRVTSPVGRQPSLRSKLSLPNLKRSPGRQGSISSGKELVQVEDMDFELIRPTVPQIQGRSSEDTSSFVGRDASFDRPNPSFRTESPSVMSSGQLSPVVSDAGSWPRPNSKTSDSESSSIDAHRQRELKWVSLMSQVPAAQSRKNKKMRKLLSEGVPSSVRYLVWCHLMDSKARNVPGVYTQLGQRARVAAFADIERDVGRCFADHPQLATSRGPVLSLLQAYLTMVPDIQYTTGLTLIAGHLLLLAPEEDAFWIFVSMMDTYLRPYFSANTIQLEVDAALFGRALESNDSKLAKKVLIDMSIPPTKICYPWFSTLFVGVLPTDYLNRVWDVFLYEGQPFLLRVALALAHCCRPAILESRSEESVLNCLRRPNLQWLPSSSDAFIALAQSLKLKDDDIRKQRVKMEAQVKRQTQMQPRMASNSISLPRN